MKRETGFYWVKHLESENWEPAFYDEETDKWHEIDYVGWVLTEPYGFLIDERRIKRIRDIEDRSHEIQFNDGLDDDINIDNISSTYDDMVFVYEWEQ